MSSTNGVYTGAWTNWSHGRFRGATLTLPQEYAGLLTAFLAIFVSFAGTMMWRILSFIIHQANVTHPSEKRDFLHHSRQVILRNSGSGTAAAWAFTMLAWNAGRKAPRGLLRILPLALIALLNVALFGVSGVFTSYVTKVPGNTTIILGPHCGGSEANAALDTGGVYLSKLLEDTKQAAAYAKQCYQGSSSLACGRYVRQSLPFTTQQNASCPFAKGLCRFNDQSAFAMDTGLLDSHNDFGINAPPENRIKFRRLTTCSPIYGADFGTDRDEAGLGPVVYINAGIIPQQVEIGNNWTFSYVARSAVDRIHGYSLSSVYGQADPTGDLHSTGLMWYPDPKLNQTDSDITLMMLTQNDVYYQTPSDDPWIAAHEKLNGSDLYKGDYTVSLLGCIDQYQFCNPNGGGDTACSKLGGMNSVAKDLTDRFVYFNNDQLATLGRFMRQSHVHSMYQAVQGWGGSALDIGQKLYNGLQYSVPPNQWQIEVSNWFALSLAKEQAWAIEWATEPQNLEPPTEGDESPWEYSLPTTPAAKSQCRNQLIHNVGDYKSLSILGMGLILALGGVIIILGLFLDTAVGLLQRGRWAHLREQWQTEETLGLHRAAYQALGVSTDWSDEVPPSSVFQGLNSSTDRPHSGLVGDADAEKKSDGSIMVAERNRSHSHGIV
ncbi:hypothetical protein BDV26DRAFT_287882 [Aspergillus bertholletiae]|uniref:Uncharacterized protein n=1 Tax=Aspergillus bertholletiae TaxID=1226010 RepID=A0A5N7BMN9_9EURO|nr:hypothetical protein BDV26DRAFT_287882 [Aspergillus bertholletiae]